MAVTTSTGVKLESNRTTQAIEDYAARYGITLRCFLATMPSGWQEYVLMDAERQPIYANTNVEAIGARIDMMHIAEKFKVRVSQEAADAPTKD